MLDRRLRGTIAWSALLLPGSSTAAPRGAQWMLDSRPIAARTRRSSCNPSATRSVVDKSSSVPPRSEPPSLMPSPSASDKLRSRLHRLCEIRDMLSSSGASISELMEARLTL
eukprot:scaffold13290_cov150-Isochrysis_galbana.AAC.3